jgi:hypothetical protein
VHWLCSKAFIFKKSHAAVMIFTWIRKLKCCIVWLWSKLSCVVLILVCLWLGGLCYEEASFIMSLTNKPGFFCSTLFFLLLVCYYCLDIHICFEFDVLSGYPICVLHLIIMDNWHGYENTNMTYCIAFDFWVKFGRCRFVLV